MYQRIAPDMPFKSVCKLAEEAEQNSKDHSNKNYVLLLLLEMIGIDSNGHFPDWMKEKAANNIQFAYAMQQAGLCHGGHSCGVPGYEISMKEYYQKFIRSGFNIEAELKRRQDEYKESLKKTA